MIALLFLPLLRSVLADPIPQPFIYGRDSMGGMLYDIPEYEDPDLTLYELSAFGAMPVLSIVEMGNEVPGEGDAVPPEQVANIKKGVEKVIAKLHGVVNKLEKGSSQVFKDVDKSIQDLKKIERELRNDNYQLPTSIRKSISITVVSSKPIIKRDGTITVAGADPINAQQEMPDIVREDPVSEIPFGGDKFAKEAKKAGEGEKELKKKWARKSSGVL